MHEKHSTLAVLFQPIHFPPLKATRLSCLRGILEPSLIFLEENRSHSRRAISAGESRSGKLYGLVRITTDKSSSRFCSLSLFLSRSLFLPASGSFLWVNNERVVRWCGPSWLSALHTFQPDKRTETVSTTYAYSRSLLKIVPVLAATSLIPFFNWGIETGEGGRARWLPLLAVPRNKNRSRGLLEELYIELLFVLL